MSIEWRPMRGPGGSLLQSGVPKSAAPISRRGLLLRGAVTATYVFDSPESPYTDVGATPPEKQGIYCDVWCYGSRFKGHIPRVLVLQDRGALHEGRIWKPRAAKLDVTGGVLDLNLATNPANLDGDHVLIGFIDDNPNQPIILGGVPHPSSDIGNDSRDAGHRYRLKLADGQPDYWKHRGAYYGVDDKGNWRLDLRRAHKGEYLPDGKEPEPALSGESGNVEFLLPKGSTVTIKIEDGRALKLEDKEASTKMTIGDGAKHVAIVEHLQSLYEQLKTKLDAFDTAYLAHTHIYAFGPTLPATSGGAVAVGAPGWDSAINSTKVSLPDT